MGESRLFDYLIFNGPPLHKEEQSGRIGCVDKRAGERIIEESRGRRWFDKNVSY